MLEPTTSFPRLCKAMLIAALTANTSLSAETNDSAPSGAGKFILPESALPEYEAKIDHKRLINHKSPAVLKQGKAIYQKVCHNCHGDHQTQGSIPNALRFSEGQFQHGSDPHTMYQTITRGWRSMVPQPQLTPLEKYAVIHYIREAYLKTHNPSQYVEATAEYKNALPKGTEVGPAPVVHHPWVDMDYGNFMNASLEISTAEDRKKFQPGRKPAKDSNIAYKGVSVRLDDGDGGVSKGQHWVVFEHDTLRIAGAWEGDGFIDWLGINFNGRHTVIPRTMGEPTFQLPDGPGWANPETGDFQDKRTLGSDGRHFGPLPKAWGKFLGLYQYGKEIIFSYRIGTAEVLESHAADSDKNVVRHLNIGSANKDLKVRLATLGFPLAVAGSAEVQVIEEGGFQVALIPASATPVKLAITLGSESSVATPTNLSAKTQGSSRQWPEVIETPIKVGQQAGAFQWDQLTLPTENPWKSRMRSSGIDFSADQDSAYLCCWDGDVWKVEGLKHSKTKTLRWTRIAAGLFQPLGIKVVNGEIFVSCRDQIVKLVDLNGDGETDFYQNFNSDHQVTEHFHEFAMGLQADAEGNLYYAKSARHALPPLVPQHGTLLKVSADGSQTEILAKGFRAANGVCRNPDGSFYVTDQEGHWNPMNRINHVVAGDHFYGNMWGYGAPDDESNDAMEQPLCWVDKRFDRSPAELLWIDSPAWGALNGSLLHLSYGHGRVQIVLHEVVGTQIQGGMQRLPIPDFPTGTMRGRFSHADGHLYLCGMAAWGTAARQEPGGFYRIRATGKPANLAVKLQAHTQGIDITFDTALAAGAIRNHKEQFEVSTWALERTAKYGSAHFDKKALEISAAELSADRRTLKLTIPNIEPCWQMSIKFKLQNSEGVHFNGEIQNTIHALE